MTQLMMERGNKTADQIRELADRVVMSNNPVFDTETLEVIDTLNDDMQRNMSIFTAEIESYGLN